MAACIFVASLEHHADKKGIPRHLFAQSSVFCFFLVLRASPNTRRIWGNLFSQSFCFRPHGFFFFPWCHLSWLSFFVWLRPVPFLNWPGHSARPTANVLRPGGPWSPATSWRDAWRSHLGRRCCCPRRTEMGKLESVGIFETTQRLPDLKRMWVFWVLCCLSKSVCFLSLKIRFVE